MNRRSFHPVALCCAFFLFFASTHAAQLLSPPAHPEVMPFIPTLRVNGAEQPVRLQGLSIQLSIEGGIAEITLDMIFFNPNHRVLEGELQFPLLPGQEISGLALDINGELRAGVPVPKARGQEIFEAIARRNVDPALLEATQGNAYKLRLYPIPARGTRRVVVRVLQPLAAREGVFTLRLPLAFASHIDNFSVEALVASSEPPQVDSGSLGLVLEKTGMLYRGKVEKTGLSPEGWLTISFPAASAPDDSVNAVRWRDRIYFTGTASVEARAAERTPPKLVTVVWDASGSGQNRDHAREFDLLDRYFAAIGEGQLRLVVVRDAAAAPEVFPVRGGDWREARQYLHNLPYDGGTNLASWKPADDCAEYLLFSDGLANFGIGADGDALPAMRSGQRLYAINSSTEADHNLLRHASQGRLIDLLRLDDETAARLLLSDSTRVSIAPGNLAGRGEVLLDPISFPISDSNRLECRIAGWIKARDNGRAETVTLNIEHPDGKLETVSLVVPSDAAVPAHAGEDAPLPARLWGRYAVMEMEANAHRHQAAIERLGRELGIVSRETSLIVLETAEDYLRYDVTPPGSLRAEVERLRLHGGFAARRDSYLSMERLHKMWAEKVAWWEKDFPEKGVEKKEAPYRRMNAEMSEQIDIEREWENLDYIHISDDTADLYSIPQALPLASVSPGLSPPLAGSSVPAPRVHALTAGSSESAVAQTENEDAEYYSKASNLSGIADPSRNGLADSSPVFSMGIALQGWRSDAPYIARLNRAKKDDMYAIYLDERPSHARSSAFFLDMADRFFAAEMPELGVRILSNLVEIEIENRQLLRMLAYRLMEAKEARLALGVLEKVLVLAPHEPQSLRDLANAHKAVGNEGKAAELLYEVARREWDGRFPDINVIALTELNALVATAKQPIDTASFDSRVIRNLASDLRVVLTWDTDNTDLDLWVTDPDGEKCYYENRLTRLGGAMTRDCTGGYGPEEFMLKRAKPGVYRVEANYYGASQQVLAGEVTLQITLTTGFGTAEQKEQVVTMRLKNTKDNILVGEFTVK